jgi:hypothetical protein
VTRNGLPLILFLALCLTGCATSGAGRKEAPQEAPANGDPAAQAPASVKEGGSCRPLLRHLSMEFDEDKDVRHSCWNRVWEVPTAIVVYPAVVVIMIGVVTSPIWVPLLFLF